MDIDMSGETTESATNSAAPSQARPAGETPRKFILSVKNLPIDCIDEDIEDLFRKFGRLNDAYVKSGRSGDAREATVIFEHKRDAELALADRNNYEYDSRLLQVSLVEKRGGDREDSVSNGAAHFNPSVNDTVRVLDCQDENKQHL